MDIKETIAINDPKAAVRAEDAARYADLARKAAAKARTNGKENIAVRLEDEATELERMAATWTQDSLDDKSHNNSQDPDAGGKKPGPDDQTAANENQPQEDQNDTSEDDAEINDEAGKDSADDNSQSKENKPGLSDKGGEGQKGGSDSQAGDKDSNSDSQDSDSSDGGDQGDEGDNDSDGDSNDGDNADSDEDEDGDFDEEGEDSDDDNDGEDGEESDEDDESGQSSKGKSGNKGDSDDSDDVDDDTEDEDSEDDGDSSQSSKGKSGSKSNSNKSDDDESDNDDDPVKDIFDMQGQQSSQNSGDLPKEPRDPTLDEIKKMLSQLSGNARRGAFDGINDLLKNRPTADATTTESLHEGIFTGKNLRDMDDDEWADGLNSILELANSIDPVNIIDPKDKKNRLTAIKQMSKDKKLVKELEREQNLELAKDYQKKKALEKESEKYSNYRSLDAFKINFYNAIKDQVDMVKERYKSYNEINPEYEDDDIIVKADVEKEIPDEAIPVVNLYFDRSGSWDDGYSIDIGKQIVATIKEFEDQGDIKLNVLYFSNTVTPDENDASLGGGTGAWTDIIQNIQATKANNVVLMTDTDMDYDALTYGGCRVEGCVWFVWRLSYQGQQGPKYIPQKLRGTGYSGEYAFYKPSRW